MGVGKSFQGHSVGKESACNVGDTGDKKIPWSGMATHSRILAKNSMEKGAWQAIVYRVMKSQT